MKRRILVNGSFVELEYPPKKEYTSVPIQQKEIPVIKVPEIPSNIGVPSHDWTKNDLMDYCTEKGIKFVGVWNKSQLLRAIGEFDAEKNL